MPEIRDIYTDTEQMDIVALHQRREAIIDSAPKNDDGSPRFTDLGDEPLSELLAINRALRKKVATSNGGKRATSGGSRKKSPATLDDVL